ncbi:MAG: hypothetical protein ACRDZN_06710 [Acidimicrobiales bacterium]
MTVRIDQADLFAFVATVFRRCGLADGAADAAAEAMCYGDARGITTHGTSALAGNYVPRLLDGSTPPPSPSWSRTPAPPRSSTDSRASDRSP